MQNPKTSVGIKRLHITRKRLQRSGNLITFRGSMGIVNSQVQTHLETVLETQLTWTVNLIGLRLILKVDTFLIRFGMKVLCKKM